MRIWPNFVQTCAQCFLLLHEKEQFYVKILKMTAIYHIYVIIPVQCNFDHIENNNRVPLGFLHKIHLLLKQSTCTAFDFGGQIEPLLYIFL